MITMLEQHNLLFSKPYSTEDYIFHMGHRTIDDDMQSTTMVFVEQFGDMLHGMSENFKNFDPEKMIRTLLQLDAREKGLTVEVTVKAKDDNKEGSGIFTFSDGRKFIGLFKEDHFFGNEQNQIRTFFI